MTFMESNTHVDLVILEMVDFDAILGMNWLSYNVSCPVVQLMVDSYI